MRLFIACKKLYNRNMQMKSIQQNIKDLHPAYFALVMATGIVSLACRNMGLERLGEVFFYLNLIQYVALFGILCLRLIYYRTQVIMDITDPAKGLGFFTLVAANSIIGIQVFFFTGSSSVAGALWWVSLFLWCGLIYSIFVGMITKENKGSIEKAMNGGWLLSIVATQSITVLGSTVASSMWEYQEELFFALTAFWLFGTMLYIWIITLIFYRYMFYQFSPSDLMPPYWINMGAAAISTLAGVSLLSPLNDVVFLQSIAPFLRGFSIMNWATATWWVPMLLFLGIWRHVIKKIPLSYHPLYWGLVFPLGMYSVCTYKLALIFPRIYFLIFISRIFFCAALVAWSITYLGFMKRLKQVIFSK